jgi:hypothetical protein
MGNISVGSSGLFLREATRDEKKGRDAHVAMRHNAVGVFAQILILQCIMHAPPASRLTLRLGFVRRMSCIIEETDRAQRPQYPYCGEAAFSPASYHHHKEETE